MNDGAVQFPFLRQLMRPRAVFTAEHERRLLQIGNDDDASGFFPQIPGNVLVGNGMDLSKHISGLRDSLDVVGVRRKKRRGHRHRQSRRRDDSSHILKLFLLSTWFREQEADHISARYIHCYFCWRRVGSAFRRI